MEKPGPAPKAPYEAHAISRVLVILHSYFNNDDGIVWHALSLGTSVAAEKGGN